MVKHRPPKCCDRDQRVTDVNRAPEIDLYGRFLQSGISLKGGAWAIKSPHVLYVDLAGGGVLQNPPKKPGSVPGSGDELGESNLWTNV